MKGEWRRALERACEEMGIVFRICSWCGMPIDDGEKVVRRVGVGEKGFLSDGICLSCKGGLLEKEKCG